MNITVVVDGGGTGCRLGAYDENGVLCATANDGPASLTLGEDQAWRHITRGIGALASQLGKRAHWQPEILCMGLAGSLQQIRRERFLAFLPKQVVATLVTDGHAQLLGATAGEPGICLAIGTGSVMHWLDESGAMGMAGGWGFPMGDEASGAWLGAKAINAYLWHRDNHALPQESSPLFTLLEERIGHDVSDIQLWSTNTRANEVASLAPLVLSAALQLDSTAVSILDSAVDQCRRLISMAPEQLPLYLVGGLSGTYVELFDDALRARCHTPVGDALSGLYALSKENVAG